MHACSCVCRLQCRTILVSPALLRSKLIPDWLLYAVPCTMAVQAKSSWPGYDGTKPKDYLSQDELRKRAAAGGCCVDCDESCISDVSYVQMMLVAACHLCVYVCAPAVCCMSTSATHASLQWQVCSQGRQHARYCDSLQHIHT